MASANVEDSLTVPQLKILIQYKSGKKSANMNKTALMNKRNEVKDKPVKNIVWEDSDESLLHELQMKEITLEDTEVGRQAKIMLSNATAALDKLPAETIKEEMNSEQLKTFREFLDVSEIEDV